jgi:hypothetical protein
LIPNFAVAHGLVVQTGYCYTNLLDPLCPVLILKRGQGGYVRQFVIEIPKVNYILVETRNSLVSYELLSGRISRSEEV